MAQEQERNCNDTSRSSIRLLVSGSSTVTAELLGLHTSGVSNEEALVVLDKQFLELSLCSLVVVLLVVGDEALRDGLADSDQLGSGTTAANAHADVQVLEALGAKEEDGLPHLETEGGWLEKLKGLAIDFDESSAGGAVGNSGRVLLSAEALNLFCFFVSHLFLS